MIKTYLTLAAILLLLPMIVGANEHTHEPESEGDPLALLVYKTPTCGCCKKWITHIEDQGIIAFSQDYRSLEQIKNHYGIKSNHRSCHTAVTQSGFVFEGHIPAKFIKQFLSEKHTDAIGLTVPAMPIGSPGMEVGHRFMPYNILMLTKNGTSKVFATVRSYEEQF
ncbi:DUF411 domain-containing protein [Thalassotalea sp. 1_MG-2023]|uniref:DUF411 domain-containing protein n=1 Tax=Thalassotalea sp. 1_MG-2023 TaxID=3062680 RepID=UPI0026E31AB1|nr:DUF411 domain-containing protein [Thalassotalea sp. 1_MG-2023]MDO6427007.1 DUF411 domain-containing protein [Thalassotalea sp. 1_MG-2023]